MIVQIYKAIVVCILECILILFLITCSSNYRQIFVIYPSDSRHQESRAEAFFNDCRQMPSYNRQILVISSSKSCQMIVKSWSNSFMLGNICHVICQFVPDRNLLYDYTMLRDQHLHLMICSKLLYKEYIIEDI